MAGLGSSWLLRHPATWTNNVMLQLQPPIHYCSASCKVPQLLNAVVSCNPSCAPVAISTSFLCAVVGDDEYRYNANFSSRRGRAVIARTARFGEGSFGGDNGRVVGKSSAKDNAVAAGQVRPSPAEAARTIVDICTEGTLSTLTEDEWPTATAVRFALDMEGRPVFLFSPSALHTQNLALDSRCSLHVQLEQPGRQRPQCTLRGRVQRVDSPNLALKLDLAWDKRFGKEHSPEDVYYIMIVDQALYAQDMGEEEVRVSGSDYAAATADPLRECAPRIVEDMNRKHWEDVRRFCNSHAQINAEVEEASMTWVDRLGFDLRVLTKSPHTLLEIRIPFSREVSDERDARSSLTMMAQIAWEQERSYTPPDIQLLGSLNI